MIKMKLKATLEFTSDRTPEQNVKTSQGKVNFVLVCDPNYEETDEQICYLENLSNVSKIGTAGVLIDSIMEALEDNYPLWEMYEARNLFPEELEDLEIKPNEAI